MGQRLKPVLQQFDAGQRFSELWAGGRRVQLKMWLAAVVLLLLVLVSALAVVYSSFKSRQLFSDLQQMDRHAVQLEEDWGRLLLEQSTWSSYSRIEQIARARLDMVVPEAADIVLVEPQGRVE